MWQRAMRLVVDANVLVGELTRRRGQDLIAHASLDLAIAERAWDEAQYELRRRIGLMQRHGALSPAAGDFLLATGVALANRWLAVIPVSEYEDYEEPARRRIPRDPDDWPTVALALALDAAIWTHDHDFLGCGIATWTTDTLLSHLTA